MRGQKEKEYMSSEFKNDSKDVDATHDMPDEEFMDQFC